MHGAEPAVLAGPVLRAWARGATAALESHRAALDSLNVFPVADADTGTNLYLTLCEASHRAGSLPPDAPADAVARAVAHGALVGARGSSGIIVSQYVGALVERLVVPHGPADGAPGAASGGARLAAALQDAAGAAWAAVAQPVEGTVLTVAREVGEHCRAAVAAGARSPADALRAALDGGYAALDRTTDQLAVLRAAGVRDAGGWGLLIVLDALLAEVGGPAALRPVPGAGARWAAAPPGPRQPAGDRAGGTEFEVMSLVETAPGGDPAGTGGPGAAGTAAGIAAGGPAGVAARLRAALREVGDAVAVVEAAGLWHVHVHTDDPLAAVRVAGRLGLHQREVGVRHLGNQAGVHGGHRPAVGLVAVTTAPGLSAELARAGAVVVVAGPGGVVEAAAVQRAVQDTGAARVLVLVGGGVRAPRDLRLPGRGEPGPPVRVEVLQGITEAQVVAGAATLAAVAGGPSAEQTVREVTAAVAAVRGAVVDPVGPGGHAALVSTADGLLRAGADLLTVVTSAATPAGAVAQLVASVRDRFPVDVVVLEGAGAGSAVVLAAEGGVR